MKNIFTTENHRISNLLCITALHFLSKEKKSFINHSTTPHNTSLTHFTMTPYSIPKNRQAELLLNVFIVGVNIVLLNFFKCVVNRTCFRVPVDEYVQSNGSVNHYVTFLYTSEEFEMRWGCLSESTRPLLSVRQTWLHTFTLRHPVTSTSNHKNLPEN